jgi:hypothetical protein
MRASKSPIAALWGLLILSASPAGWAEVTATGPSGFSLKIETTVAGAPTDAFNHFIQIGRWWNAAHTYSGDAANLALSAKPGGCFCETLPGGGFVKHMDVVYAAPGKTLRLFGGLGPLQGMGAAGALTFDFKAEGANTRVTVTYVVSGFAPGPGLAPLATPVDGVLMGQLARFKHFAETGKPTG